MFEPKLLIGGRHVSGIGGAFFERRNPIDGEVVTRAAAATVKDAQAAADAAAAAFPQWSASGPGERRELLLRAERLFVERTPDFLEVMQAELGAAAGWSHFNVHLAAGLIREAASMTTQLAGQVIPSDIPGMLAMTQRRAAGVCLGIAPWNAPLILGVRAIVMPLACGNTTLLKGSEISPATHAMIADVFLDAGFPAGTVNYISNAPADAAAVVNALIAHPAVRRINFTGSTHVGRLIATAAAAQLKPALLELGGKAPMVVLDDADLDGAAAAASFGSFMNQGQICMSTEKIVVDEKIADDFVARFVKRAAGLTTGDPRTGNVHLGAMAMPGAAGKVGDLIADAVAKGATVALAGTSTIGLLTPTILDRVIPSMRIYSEESFGPVASIVRVQGVEEAVKVANDTEYGLAASVFGKDLSRAMAVANRIDAGSRHVNMATVHDQPQMPFGGVKASGYGRFGGLEAIYEFTDTCLLTVQASPPPTPI